MTDANKIPGVAAVDRALAILAAFRQGEAALSLAELAARTGMYKSTILRLAASLERAGYLVRLDDRQWRLGPALSRLGALYMSAFNLRDYVEPALKRAAEASGESVAFYVKEGGVRVCLFRVEARQSLRHHISVGEHLPLDRGGPGRILTAFNGDTGEIAARVRSNYYYISLGERDPEVFGVAVPVFDADGLVGALAIIGPSVRMRPGAIERHLVIALTESASLTGLLGGSAHGLLAALAARQERKEA